MINRRVNLGLTRGNRDGGGAKIIKKIEEFSFRGILQPTTVSSPRDRSMDAREELIYQNIKYSYIIHRDLSIHFKYRGAKLGVRVKPKPASVNA